METIFSPDHVLRASKTELAGGELVRPYECPERMDYILASIRDAGLGAVSAPDAMGGNAIGTNAIVTDAIKPAISKMICARDGRGRAGIDCYPSG